MKRHVLFVSLVGISLVFAVVIRLHQAANAQLEQSLAMLENLPKSELDRFRSDAKDFYQHNSKAGRDEQKRLRRLYNQIQNDPENERLTKTMDQYVEWVNSFSDLAIVRDSQTRPLIDRVEIIQKAVQSERNNRDIEMPVTFDRLKASLPPELRSIDLTPLFNAFDVWLTKKYDETKSDLKPTLNEEQLKSLPDFEALFEAFYRDLFHRAGIETSPVIHLGLPEKMAMIQLMQNLSGPQRGGGGGGPRPGSGGPRPGGGSGSFPFEVGGLRGEFLRTIDEAIDRKEANPFLDSLDVSEKQVLERNDRSAPRMEVLQGLLTLAVLERYPKAATAADAWRFFQATSREDQDWIRLLGNYLSMMSPTRREEFLKLEPRYTTRLQGELRGNVMPFFGLLLRSNRERPAPPNLVPTTPMSPRDGLMPTPGPTRPQRPGSGQENGRVPRQTVE